MTEVKADVPEHLRDGFKTYVPENFRERFSLAEKFRNRKDYSFIEYGVSSGLPKIVQFPSSIFSTQSRIPGNQRLWDGRGVCIFEEQFHLVQFPREVNYSNPT